MSLKNWSLRQQDYHNSLLANQALKLTVASWVRYALRVVGLRFYYSVISTYYFDTYQFGYQHELVSLGACCKFAVPQLSARPLGRNQNYIIMKSLSYTLIIIAITVIQFPGCKSHMRTEIAQLADSIAQVGVAHGSVIGMMPNTYVSNQFLRFVHLADSSTTPELLELSKHLNPTVRFYSLQALSYRDDEAVLSCLRSHLSDTAEASTLLFDMVSSRPISWFVADEFLERYCLKTPTKKLDYIQIRDLAKDTLVPSALVALARFRKSQDITFLQSRIRQSIFVLQILPNGRSPYYSSYGLAAIREFPDSSFYPILEQSVINFIAGKDILRRMLFQAIVQYKTESAVRLLQSAVNYSDRENHYRTQADLAIALIKYPDLLFRDRFSEQINLDFKSIVTWHKFEEDNL
jgi:hypothetical protein